MSVVRGEKAGYVVVDGEITYQTKVPSNRPYCHFCRQQVDAIVVLDRSGSGNPLHSCKRCLVTRLNGFDSVEEV